MKLLKYSALILLAILTFSSCSKYLDVKPPGKVLLTTYDDYNKVLNNTSLHIYNNAEIAYLNDQVWINELAVIGRDPGIATISFLGDSTISRFNFLLSGTNGLYGAAYASIARFCLVIDNVEKATNGTPAQIKRLMAEARTLRAFAHFLLLNTYAKPYNAATAATDRGICIKSTFNVEVLEKQATVAEVYNFVEAELLAAVNDLANTGENQFHPGKAFAYGLLAKMYLYKGEYAKAKAAAQQSLAINNYVYDMVKYYQNGQTENVDMAMPENLYYAIGGSAIATPNNSIISKEMYESFGASDTRGLAFFSTTAPAVQVGAGTAAFIKLPTGNSRFCYNTVGIKTTEMYLTLAECFAREGNVNAALQNLDEVRKKRILPQGYQASNASTPADAMKLILTERRKELLFGFNRFWDQRRLGNDPANAITVVRKFPVVNTAVPQVTYTIPPNSPLYILPFDKSVILNNPNIQQNAKDEMNL
ncbi:SusD-like starch-binding protein associating with outer membrane [Chitinophaga skermanii]|uniref:SusD-like starch-binding protein associating with outer membrane n=1 Tax=Chitinophaga skermanii TaxID=331697 RepID=A0A327QUW4_9BACT|nr:RagB/SusD family nutrient uptake outer membrane protein [Chitinophaga skermanii]RAJ08466.1 SusD-like starch-binding protein associating with outer membrane [Chitinophaga skermanii]